MRSPLVNWRESLENIKLAVHDDDNEMYGHSDDRRNSHSFAHSTSSSRSPLSNGIDSPYNMETEHCKAEIKRLQESEAELKALAVNYAALLKEKERKDSHTIGEDTIVMSYSNERILIIMRTNVGTSSKASECDAYKSNRNMPRNDLCRRPNSCSLTMRLFFSMFEDQISRWNKENGALKQSLDSTTSTRNNLRVSTNASNMQKENGDLSPNRQLKGGQFKSHTVGSPGQNGVASRQDIMSNGT